MGALDKVREFLDGWVKGTDAMIACVENIMEIIDKCTTVDEFKACADEIVNSAPPLLRDQIKSVVDEAIHAARQDFEGE